MLVDEKRWLDERAFLVRAELLHAAARPRGDAACDLCRLAAAWHQGRPRGGPAVRAARRAARAGALDASTRAFGKTPVVAALFVGVKAAVLAIVLEALLRVASRALQGPHRLAHRRRCLCRHLLLRCRFRWSSSPPQSPAISAPLRQRPRAAAAQRSCRQCRCRRRCAPCRLARDLDRAAAAVVAPVRARPRAGAARAGSSPSSRSSPSAAPTRCSPTWRRTWSSATAG